MAPPTNSRSVLRWPWLTYTLLLGMMAAFVAWSCLSLVFLSTENSARTAQIRELEQLRGRITHLDEVLTMSASMAAASGETAYVDRYQEHEVILTEAISQAGAIAPGTPSAEATAEINAANDALVTMEHDALRLVRAGRNEEARAVLGSQVYTEHKRTYAAGLNQLGAALQAEADVLKIEQDRQALLVVAPGGVLLLVLLGAGILSLRALRRWHADAWDVNEQLVRQKRELAELRSTERKQAQSRLIETSRNLKAESEARAQAESDLDLMFNSTPDMLALGGFDGFFKRVNPTMVQFAGYTEQELMTRPFADFLDPAQLPAVMSSLERIARGETVRDMHLRIRHKDGHFLETEWHNVPFLDRGQFLTVGRDISRRVEIEESLRRTAATLAEAQRIGKVGSWEIDLVTGASKWSDETFRLFGLEPGEVEPTSDFFFSMVHPDDRERMMLTGGTAPRNGEHHLTEYRVVLKDGSVREMINNLEFEVAPDGRPLKIYGTCQDITGSKDAERKQTKLEEQLRASQKMEAVGSLAGGIAHDFNNLLSVILSYVGFVLDELPRGDSRRDDLGEVKKAAERAAALTRQLLAFGRKQVLQPVPMNLNDVATGMENMLRRILGEDVSMIQNLDPDLGLTMADPGQIEQVTMNLVVNARDAMPRGGCLTIETGNVEIDEDQHAGLKPGHYVTLTVSDSGTGMDKATLAHMFEPFFTTKEVGKGTGLGLSTVYGIVKQSGGGVTVYSEFGIGSTFRVYLPRDMSGAQPNEKRSTAPLQLLGKETILLVEDEAAVRNSAERILSSAGYSVLTAGNGLEGLKVCESFPGEIELVLTDVVMPKMSGALFARELARLRPETRILFMSGYSGDAIAHHGMLEPGTQFIGKPFNAMDLTRKVRQVLDTQREAYSTDPTDVAVRIKEAS